jgi:hypothetical protein
MATVLVTRRDVARMFALPDSEAVESLIHAGILTIAAYTVPAGQPLFNVEHVRRATPAITAHLAAAGEATRR